MALEQGLFYKWLVASQLASFKIWTLQITQWRGKELVDLVENHSALKEKERTASRDRESFPKKAWADACQHAWEYLIWFIMFPWYSSVITTIKWYIFAFKAFLKKDS